MKIHCDVIKDLLPLYNDNCCSKQTRLLVEQHLQTCEDCSNLLKQYQDDFSINLDKKEGEPMKTVAKEWNKRKKLSFTKGIFLTSLIVAIICPISYKIIGSEVLPDGTLVEPFALIPLFYLFLLISVVSGIVLLISSFLKFRKHNK